MGRWYGDARRRRCAAGRGAFTSPCPAATSARAWSCETGTTTWGRRLTAELAVPLLRVLDAGVVEHDELARVLLDLARSRPRVGQLQTQLDLGSSLLVVLAEAVVADGVALRGAVQEEREVEVVGAVWQGGHVRI